MITFYFFKNKFLLLPCCTKQLIKAFPCMPSGHLHIGMWLYTSQIAFVPQVPGHGSLHLLWIHALFLGQSLFNTHSGLHPKYGSPWNSGLHVQTPL